MKKEVILGLIAFVFTLSFVSAAAPTDYLSLWKFDNNLNDEMSNYNGAATGVVSYTTGVEDEAVVLNAGHVSAGDITELNSASAISVSLWAKDSNQNDFTQLFGKINGLNEDFQASSYVGRIYFEVGAGSNAYAYWNDFSSEIAQDEWFHVVFVFDGAQATNPQRAKVYVNGDQKPLIFSDTFPAQTANLAGFDFMFSDPTYNWEGAIDNAQMFTRALSSSEIQDIYLQNYTTGPVCGDGIIESPEVCDSNTVSCSGGTQECNSQCTGFEVCILDPVCGNGIIESGEVCDSNTISCTGGTQDCQSDCQGYEQCVVQDLCGNGILNAGEVCDDGNTNNFDECSNECEFGFREFPLQTCQGEGEVFAYHTTPMQDLEKEFITQRDELYVMTRADFISDVDVYLNNVLAPKSVVVSTPIPFGIKVYKVSTSPGDVVRLVDSSLFDSRAIQGVITQDAANPALNIDDFNIVLDNAESNDLTLAAGSYDFVVFDKYSADPPGFDPDNRRLTVIVEDDTNTEIFNQNYTDPNPGNVEGIVLDSYTIPAQGDYEFLIDTEDSVYWFLQNCTFVEPPCEDEDNDGVCDPDDECLDSKPGEPVDEDGCDPFQFCFQFSCGVHCDTADFMDNEPENPRPNDCKTVIVEKEGIHYPFCRPTYQENQCFG